MKKLVFSKRQREIIVGLLLGDGHLETQTNGRTYRLKVEHSIKQKAYIEWLYNELQDLIPGKIYVKESKERTFVGFQTHTSPSFRFYGHQFYPERKELIPKLIKKLLTPLALSIWFMG